MSKLEGRRPSLGLGLATALMVLFGLQGVVQAEPCPEHRPCVGLVLAGGGARGAAHVGVLEVMEELRVPVDFIVGTSMGAIVGGMYASGMSPEEMRESINEIDWEEAFNDDPPRRNIPFRLKEDDDKPLFKLEFGFNKDGFRSPTGLVAGQKLNFILSSLLIHQAGPRNFDDLPIPFRAIAVDLASGDVEVIDRGSLVTAIRASMAFPVFFTPVELGDKLLVDGGVLLNLPVEAALDLDADHVIAVDVGSPIRELEGESESMFKVLRRTISVMGRGGRDDQRAMLRDGDLLLTPDLEGIRAFESFEEMGEVIERGVTTARQNAERLRRFTVSEEEFARYLERQRAGKRRDPFVVDRVEVSGVKHVSPKRITRRIVSTPGQGLDLEVLRTDLERAYQIGEFEQVGFAVDREAEETVLMIDAREKSWGPWFYRLGVALAADFGGSGDFTGNVLLRRPNLNPLGAEWKSFVTIGAVDLLSTELYQPLEYSGTFFVAPRLVIETVGEEWFVIGGEQASFKIEAQELGLDFGIRIRNTGELRLGWTVGEFEGTPRSFEGDPIKADTGGARARLTIDRLDNANFPSFGTAFDLELFLSRRGLGADDDYERLFVSLGHAWRIGRWTTVASLSGGSDFESELPFQESFHLGGFLSLSGLEARSLSGSQSALARVVPYRRVGELPSLFGGQLYLGGSLEAGNVWPTDESVSASDLRAAGSVWAGVDTLFGPLYFAYGLAEGGQGSWYLFLGRVFGTSGSARNSGRLGR